MTVTTRRTRTPLSVDTDLAAAHHELAKADSRLAAALYGIHTAIKDRAWYQRRTKIWNTADDVAVSMARTLSVDPNKFGAARAKAAVESYDRAEAGRVFAAQQVADLNEEYTGWSRFFLVSGGHIHSSMHCSTCRVTTRFGWLPELSGQTEAEAVAEHGEVLCSVCFPTAPVAWTQKKVSRTAV